MVDPTKVTRYALQNASSYGESQRDNSQRGCENFVPQQRLLITSRELVLISEEKTSPRQDVGDNYTFGAIITYFPVVRLEDFHVSHEERFGVLELRVQARHGGEKLEIISPADRERAVSKAMEQVLIHAAP